MSVELEQRVAALESAEVRKANWTWGVAALVTAAAVLLLLGLYHYHVNHQSEPTQSSADVFLATLATMLAILIAGAFIFTTFRVDHEARLVAERTARRAAAEIAGERLSPAVERANEAARTAAALAEVAKNLTEDARSVALGLPSDPRTLDDLRGNVAGASTTDRGD